MADSDGSGPDGRGRWGYAEEDDRDDQNYADAEQDNYEAGQLSQRDAAGSDDDDNSGLHPDDPLLARAQAALAAQLEKQKTKIEEQLREQTEFLRMAKKRREDIGVELYGVQQQLARLQMQLEKTHENYTAISGLRQKAESELQQMRAVLAEKAAAAGTERKKAEALQLEMNKLAGTLRQIETYNEQMKDEIAVTRRATYVAEESAARLEKEKVVQDLLIDDLQETLKGQHTQLALYAAQLAAQSQETAAAKEMLAEAEMEMENINHEKKALVAQWRSSLIGMARRDEALQATEAALQKQREQEMAIDSEVEGYKRSIRNEQERNEQLTGVLKKAEGEAEFLRRQIDLLRERGERLQETFAKLQRSLDQTSEAQEAGKSEARKLEVESGEVDKALVKVNNEMRATEDAMLTKLSEQMTEEKGAQKMARTCKELRAKAAEQTVQAVQLRNELAKIRVDILNTGAHCESLRTTLTSLDSELKEKLSTIEKYELEIRRRNDEIEKRSKEVDLLNRQYDKLTSNARDENLGPLEATIVNVTREIAAKGKESKEQQRAWVRFQTELVSLQAENNALAERVQRLKAEHTVLTQKRSRLDAQYGAQEKEIKELDKAVDKLHAEVARLNELISKNTALQAVLHTENFNLENDVVVSLKELEEESIRLEGRISAGWQEKKELLAEIVEAERQIMLWDRKISLEKETQAALNPDVGNDVVGAMTKEIHRMKLRHTELMKKQEKLIQDLELNIYKREVITVKGEAKKQRSADLSRTSSGSGSGSNSLRRGATLPSSPTVSGHKKACDDLRRTIKNTERDAAAVDANLQQLEAQRKGLGEELARISEVCRGVRVAEEEKRMKLDMMARQRDAMFADTVTTQRLAKRYEDLLAGKYKPGTLAVATAAVGGGGGDSEEGSSSGGGGGLVEQELAKAREKRAAILQLVEKLKERSPFLENSVAKITVGLSSPALAV
eukprot:jgi/Mesvir1/21841/Mv04224-RA.1